MDELNLILILLTTCVSFNLFSICISVFQMCAESEFSVPMAIVQMFADSEGVRWGTAI